MSLPPPGLPLIPRDPPMLIILSGPSGAGKDSVRDLLLEWYPNMHRVVTATTRAMRPGEVQGKDYHFISEAEFDKILETGGFIEHANVYDHRNGVPRIEIEDPLALGVDAVARVDVQGAETLRGIFPDALLIFIAPPSVEESAKRMRERDTDSEGEQRRRIEEAQREMAASSWFDHVVVNEDGKLEAATLAVIETIAREKQRRRGE